MDKIVGWGLLAIFFAALITLPFCLHVAIERRRFTVHLLLVMLTAACVLAAFLGLARDAARRNAIMNLEIERKRYQSWRQDMSPAEYQQVMDELDARAERLGVEK